MIHTSKVIECHRCPRESNFRNINLLGADFMADNVFTLKIEYRNLTCSLSK
jgi:hypothetical protein